MDTPQRDRPWLMRTYSGHSSARVSNALYRKNLDKGQTGLSVAFDLPTQTGYDSDHPLSQGEVGKVGVPISHIEDMEILFGGIPLDRMNTAMTINATAPWLLALYVAVAGRRGIKPEQLQGTVQNDVIKEYLSRGTYIFPPQPSLRLITDTIAYTVNHIPKWNPINICSYHLQEAGATPVQELTYALANARMILDAVRDSGQVAEDDFHQVVGRISFFVNAGIRFIEELCKMRAFTDYWYRMTGDRYGVVNDKLRRFRYGVQVNSLGLTEVQPENNVQRIVLEMLAVTLSKKARARAVQLPAWNEALGLPKPWDQQWALRMQQVLAVETDLLEYPDIFDGSSVIENKVNALLAGVEAELQRLEDQGGMLRAVQNGYVKRALVESQTRRMRAIEDGSLKIVGVNCFTGSEPSPLVQQGNDSILRVDSRAEREQIESLRAFRGRRDESRVRDALAMLKSAAAEGDNIMPVSIDCALAGVTTGEWSAALREVFGEYRAPTGIDIQMAPGDNDALDQLRSRVRETGERLGRPLRMLVAKPGLDGHSNGAEQIAVKARDAGLEIVYEGIRLTPRHIVRTTLEEGVHVIGLSVLSGSHLELTDTLLAELAEAGLQDVPVVLGGIIPDQDVPELQKRGIAAVFTPKDSNLNDVLDRVVSVVRKVHGLDV